MTALALLLFAAGGAAFVLGGLRLRTETASTERPEVYLASLETHAPDNPDEFDALLSQSFVARVVRPLLHDAGRQLGSITPGSYRDRLHHQIVLAGKSHAVRAEELISGQVALALAGFIGGLLLWSFGIVNARLGLLATVALPAVGLLLPKAWLDRAVQDRQDRLRRELPDVLDLLSVSVEAGVGFEGAVGIVCQNFDSELTGEFGRMLREMELGLNRREALQALRQRTEVPELSNFVIAMIQADALGMPVGRVLKGQAHELRIKRRQWAREKAAKLPVKILFPLITFIFPAILVITLAPAMSDIGSAF